MFEFSFSEFNCCHSNQRSKIRPGAERKYLAVSLSTAHTSPSSSSSESMLCGTGANLEAEKREVSRRTKQKQKNSRTRKHARRDAPTTHTHTPKTQKNSKKAHHAKILNVPDPVAKILPKPQQENKNIWKSSELQQFGPKILA